MRPDFRMQMLANNFARLDAILFTHEHNDHVAGLDDIRPFFFRQGNIPIYAHERVLNALKKRFDYIFVTENKYPGAPGVKEHIVTDNDFEIEGKIITPVSYMHNRLQVYGYRMGNFAYLTDIKSISEKEAEKLKNLEVVVVSALRIEPHHSHPNLAEALAFIEEIKPKKTYLTHISHLLGFHEEVEQSLPENVHLAYDNLKITIDEK